MIVYVEKKVLDDPAISGDESFGPVTKKFCTFREGEPSPGAGGWGAELKVKAVSVFGRPG